MPPKKDKGKQSLITEALRKSRSHSSRERIHEEEAPKSKAKRRNPRRKPEETLSDPVGNPRPEMLEQKAVEELDTTSKTTIASRPRLNKKVDLKFNMILKRINAFGRERRFPKQTIDYAHRKAYDTIVNARSLYNRGQEAVVDDIIRNISANQDTATTYDKLLYNIDEPGAQSEESFPIFPLGSEGEDTFSEEMLIDPIQAQEPTQAQEPKLSEGQLNHIKEVVKLLEREPKLKEDVKRTITEELTKGYINPDQFKKYNEEIERIKIMTEAPQTIRGKRTAKPRAKKSAQYDKPILPMDIDDTPKIPKGKTTSKQKAKPNEVILFGDNTTKSKSKPKPKPKPAPKKANQKKKPKK